MIRSILIVVLFILCCSFWENWQKAKAEAEIYHDVIILLIERSYY